MRKRISRIRLFIAIFSVLLSMSAYAGTDQAVSSPAAQKPGMVVVESAPASLSQPLRSRAPLKVDLNAPSAARTFQDRRFVAPKTQKRAPSAAVAEPAAATGASIVQNRPIGSSMPSSDANFEGVNNVSGVLPPDTQGDIGMDPSTGKKYYVQWVNLAFQIWDVTNPVAPLSLVSPTAGNVLWSGMGGICETNNDGDPLTRFDALSNRWVMSQFALGFPDDFHQCVAVSQTADPTGSWYRYDFKTSASRMNDYGKLGVWPDGYYMSFNLFDGTNYDYKGAGVAVFERDKMLLGQAARMIYFDLGLVNMNYYALLPSDLDGLAPAAGTPNYFVSWDDSTWMSDPTDTLRVWEFKTDWVNIANTTFGLNSNYDPNLKISTADVNPDMCGSVRNCVPQPDTTSKLDAIADRLMYRLQYRNFGTHQTLVGNHTVDANGSDQAGVHWFELRNTGAGFGMHQEGVYAPDSDNRWMASAAMDVSGNIALGYSVASATTYPSVRYTGRLAADPLGTLPQGEQTLVAGTGSQTSTSYRWGDYSMMAVDPSDGCTFWYTQEYVQTTGSASWQTRIGSFKYPSCSAGAVGAISGTVTDGASAPIAGATVAVSGGSTTITDAAGFYSVVLPSGTYDLTISKYGYVAGSSTGVVVTAPATTTRDFTLATAAVSIISGTVRDATTSWPLYARIDIAGYPGAPVFTNPVTGLYHVAIANGSYTFTVTALSGGYANASLPTVVTADAGSNILLTANTTTCAAPGYNRNESFVQRFETWPLAGWSIVNNVTGGLAWLYNPFYLLGNFTGGSGMAATVNSDANPGVAYDTELRSPLLNPASLTNLNLSYKANYQDYSAYDALDLDISNDGGGSWTNISNWTSDHGMLKALPGETVYVDLAPYVTAPFILRWRYYTTEPVTANTPYDWYAQIDDVSIGSTCTPTASGGLVTGSVRDANSGALVLNATVSDAALNSAVMIDASADPATPSMIYVIGQAAGTSTLTANAPSYGAGQASPTVVAGSTVGQDILLSSGQLSVNPVSLTFNLTTDTPIASLPLNLVNAGGLSSSYEIIPVPGTFTGYAPAGPFAASTRHTGPKNLNDSDASNLRVDTAPTAVTPLVGGDVSNSIVTGLSQPWGIGFNTDAGDFWLGNFSDKLDHRFTTLGVNTGDIIDASAWAVSFAADMTYNPFTNTLWQVNVSGDNCIYELDPATKTSTGNKICPGFDNSQRGLAFDPLTNTYYSGSWVDSIIHHFAPDGTLLDSASVGLAISGLAFNPGSGHLFVMTNAATTTDTTKFDVYVLDTKASYALLGGFNLKNGAVNAFADFAQAGLEMDCSGNLWAVDQAQDKVYVATSGETGVCDWHSTWLSATPASGSVASGGNVSLSANVNASDLSPGVHNAYLRVANSSPYGPVIVPVTLNLTGLNQLTVTKTGSGSGTVTSTPGGISCGSDCTEKYPPNSVVRLFATPAAGSTFGGWGGDPDCVDGMVILTAARTCTATFTIKTYNITDSVVGGNGTISCTSPVNHGSTSTCTISPAFGYMLGTLSDEGSDKLSSVSGNSYAIANVASDHLVVGTFVPIPPIRIPDQYGTLQGAYDVVLNTGSIQSQIHTFVENVVFNRPITVQLKGGYNSGFTAVSGLTTIEGMLTIQNGTAIVSDLIIK